MNRLIAQENLNSQGVLTDVVKFCLDWMIYLPIRYSDWLLVLKSRLLMYCAGNIGIIMSDTSLCFESPLSERKMIFIRLHAGETATPEEIKEFCKGEVGLKTTSTFVLNEINCVKIPMLSFSSHFFELCLFQLFDVSQSLLSIIIEKVTPIQSASSLEEDS